VDWLKTWHRLNQKRISVFGVMPLETTVIVDFKCLSVKRDRLSILLLLRRGKKIYTCLSAVEH